MPRFFIDMHDGDQVFTDDVGSSLRSLRCARAEAMQAIQELAVQAVSVQDPSEIDHRQFAAVIRDKAGNPLYRIALTFRGEDLTAGAGPEQLSMAAE